LAEFDNNSELIIFRSSTYSRIGSYNKLIFGKEIATWTWDQF